MILFIVLLCLSYQSCPNLQAFPAMGPGRTHLVQSMCCPGVLVGGLSADKTINNHSRGDEIIAWPIKWEGTSCLTHIMFLGYFSKGQKRFSGGLNETLDYGKTASTIQCHYAMY